MEGLIGTMEMRDFEPIHILHLDVMYVINYLSIYISVRYHDKRCEINFNHIKFTIISHFMFIYVDNISLCIKIYLNIYLRVPRAHVLEGKGVSIKI